jgi:hypothetical protein
MPLQRSPHSGCEPHVWGVDFWMVARDGTTIRCNVTRGALDTLLDDDGTLAQCAQRAVFEEARTQIEHVASQKYDCGHIEDGAIVVRPEDLVQAGLARV